MEAELEELFNNETLEQDFSSHSYNYVFDETVMTLSCLVGIICDIIMITAIASNKRMRTRTNLILLCGLTSDVFNLLWTPSLITDVFARFQMLSCLGYHSEVVFQLFETIAMIMLLSDTLMETKKITDKTLLLAFVGCLITILTILMFSCGMEMMIGVYITFGITMLLLLLSTLIKDIYVCYKSRTFPISEESKFRLNIVRIYSYLILSASLFILAVNAFELHMIVFGIVCMTPLYLLIYVYRNDRKFRICIMNLFRRKENRYNVDASIGFSEGVDDRKVIIDVNTI